MLINVKMAVIVAILTFMSMINFMLSWVEHEKSFITSGTGFLIDSQLLVRLPPYYWQICLSFYEGLCGGGGKY